MADHLIIMIYVISVVMRICLVCYGSWQDSVIKLKYTDVDYYVFSDAAEYVLHGFSPYMRETYRYTPLLAWILTPNHYIKVFGKLIFTFFDLITAFFIHKIVRNTTNSKRVQVISVSLWLFNPIVMTISSRGNAESIMSFLVCATISALLSKHFVFSGILFAISIHFKVYPIIYSLAIILYLNKNYESLSEVITNICKWNLQKLMNKNQIVFCVSAVITFTVLTLCMYTLYGYEFLLHSYFYHLSRKDIKHNFSVYFYMFYLYDIPWAGLFTFISQVLILVAISMYHFKNIPFCFFLLTYAFVTFNKICTSQYFLWYLSLLPLIYPSMSYVSLTELFKPIFIWFATQGMWLGSAYLLEFVGLNSFTLVWLSGLFFFIGNIWIMKWFLQLYSPAYSMKIS